MQPRHREIEIGSLGYVLLVLETVSLTLLPSLEEFCCLQQVFDGQGHVAVCLGLVARVKKSSMCLFSSSLFAHVILLFGRLLSLSVSSWDDVLAALAGCSKE